MVNRRIHWATYVHVKYNITTCRGHLVLSLTYLAHLRFLCLIHKHYLFVWRQSFFQGFQSISAKTCFAFKLLHCIFISWVLTSYNIYVASYLYRKTFITIFLSLLCRSYCGSVIHFYHTNISNSFPLASKYIFLNMLSTTNTNCRN